MQSNFFDLKRVKVTATGLLNVFLPHKSSHPITSIEFKCIYNYLNKYIQMTFIFSKVFLCFPKYD